MNPPGQIEDEQIVRYLLGALSEQETERLDQLSIADDEFAGHLSAVENDLVDAYAKGELAGETLKQFEAGYLRSSSRREKVRFARAFAAVSNPSPVAVATSSVVATGASKQQRHHRSSWRLFPSKLLIPQWGVAGVALLLILAAGILLRENLRLRGQMSQAQIERSQLESQSQQLEQSKQAAEQAAAQEGQAHLAQETATAAAPKIFAFSLAPQMRGAGQLTTIQLPPRTAFVAPELNLESDDYRSYRVALKDLTNGQVIWRSNIVKPKAKGAFRAVAIQFPASVLKPETYSFELTGLSSNGTSEFVGSYVFRVARE